MTLADRVRAAKAANPELRNCEIARALGTSNSVVSRALNHERTRERNREYNARRRASKREWERNWLRSAEGRRECSVCGKPMGVGSARIKDEGTCPTCRREGRDERYRDIQRRWLAGEPMTAIARAMSYTLGSLSRDMHRMRSEGWDLPYRKRPGRKFDHCTASREERS